MGEG
jgi:hypothetical protein